MPSPHIETFFDDSTATATHVLHCPVTREAAVIDSVLDFDPKSGRTSTASMDRVLAHLRQADLQVAWHLETHAHADHLSAAQRLKALVGGQVAIGKHIQQVQGVFKTLFDAPDMRTDGGPFDHLFEDGEIFHVGQIELRVMHTPGHTPACVTYVTEGHAFIGDTLFMPDYGSARCDFPGGDARALYRSVRKVLSLPDDTELHLCHDYAPEGGRATQWRSTVAQQRTANIHLHDGISEEAFVAMRQARDKTLSMPTLLLPSIQVNVRAGHWPPPDANGRIFLKLPVDAL